MPPECPLPPLLAESPVFLTHQPSPGTAVLFTGTDAVHYWIASSCRIPNLSIRLRNVARVMPNSFDACT